MKQKYHFYTTNEIKPEGWLKRQLEIQAEGLSGNLDLIWPDIKDSAWIGGSRDGWERVPYWLDGFIPLAYILKDTEKIARAQKYIDAILAGQQEDGWICPCRPEDRQTYDMWALLLICKVLAVYGDCSGDKRTEDAVKRAMLNFKGYLDRGEMKLFDWGKFRWFEGFIPLAWLYDKCGEAWIKELAKTLMEQGADYNACTERWERPLNLWRFDTHIVNIAMMLKYEAMVCALLGGEYTDRAEKLREKLDKFNGTAVGLFTGDECLAGLGAIHGTELCSVVEQMYSYEWLFAVTGDPKWADRLEVLAFNALPATISDDMWTHQYDQLSNQIQCKKFEWKPIFRTNAGDAHLFGLEPHFGCCTANFNQGWPKFALSAFMHSQDEIVNLVPVPCQVETQINGENVRVQVITEYPFRHKVLYRVTGNAEFALKVRIPEWAEKVTVNGKKAENGKFLSFKKKWEGSEDIEAEFFASPKLVERPYKLKCAKYGPLVFSLPIETEYVMHEYEKDGVIRKFPYCDYELIGKSKWNYAFAAGEIGVKHHKGDDIPFSSKNPRVTLKAALCEIDWGYEDGYDDVCAIKPNSTKPVSKPQAFELYPYGCAKLRMTEMPKAKK